MIQGHPRPASPLLRTHARQFASTGGGGSPSSAPRTPSFDRPPLPTSKFLAVFGAERENVQRADCYSITQTGVRWRRLCNIGHLNGGYPFSDLWFGEVEPGATPGSAVSWVGFVGGWTDHIAVELVGPVKGWVVDRQSYWQDGGTLQIGGAFTAPAPAAGPQKQDCLVVCHATCDAGGASIGTVSEAGRTWQTYNQADTAFGIRPCRKGETPLVTLAGSGGQTRVGELVFLL